jgi:membrane-associated phospholipid phosphatase
LAAKFFTGIFIFIFPFISLAQIVPEEYTTPFFQKPVVKNLVAPTILTTIGLFTLKDQGFLNKRDIKDFFFENIGKTHTNVDDYLAFTPMISVTGLHLSGVNPKNNFYNSTLLFIKSEVLMMGIAYGLKYSTHELRPDSSDYLSFPSGHTAQAFLSATIMHKEFKDKSIWYSIAGYSTATAVGVLRILNNKHWAPDVLVGAAVGILSVNLVYQTHIHRVFRKKLSNSFLYPFSSGKYNGFGLLWDL